MKPSDTNIVQEIISFIMDYSHSKGKTFHFTDIIIKLVQVSHELAIDSESEMKNLAEVYEIILVISF